MMRKLFKAQTIELITLVGFSEIHFCYNVTKPREKLFTLAKMLNISINTLLYILISNY